MEIRSPWVRRFLLLVVFGSSAALAGDTLPLPTGPDDFVMPGTQPETLNQSMLESASCSACHGFYALEVEPYGRWVGSLMAQATRDPIFHAALAIAEQDAASSGELCLRCHTPPGWLAGRAEPSDGSGLDQALGDFDGVSCHTCHRLVDPIFDPDANPLEDQQILADLTLPPTTEAHSAQFVVDPEDRRRGPFELDAGFLWHEWRESPFHRDAALCATCHDVSNPALSRQPDGSYEINDVDSPHPTHDKRDQFPVERTYSEWSASVYAAAEIETGGRFGGNKTAVSTCQDCHMPDASGEACAPGFGGEFRDDMPLHDFNGANSWVLRSVRNLYPDSQTFLTTEIVDAALARNVAMLEAAADLVVFERADRIVVRVVNRTGHKLPTGYGEGRRMWLNVRYLDSEGTLLAERGAYDEETARLADSRTRVWEILHGLDDYMSGQTGLPAGESFHFVLNNSIVKDNRIPPRGFDAAAFDQIQAPVVDHSYPEQHFWDEASFAVFPGTARVRVQLFHQTTSREYVEFLRDANTTNDAGQTAYDQWELHGKSAPVRMASTTLDLDTVVCPEPIEYGLGKLNSVENRAALSWAGSPSVSGADFRLLIAGGTPGAEGRVLMGAGSASDAIDSGTRLVANPGQIASFTLDGTGTAEIALPIGDWRAGRKRYLQASYRDASGKALSSGLHVDLCE